MGKIYVLYNPLAGNGTCEEESKKLKDIYKGEELVYINNCELEDGMGTFFDTLEESDKVVLCGGDGTLNYFINAVDVDRVENELLYFPSGSGNDFYNDICGDKDKQIFAINKYIKNLPYVEVNGMKKRFINGIGYGIDGYCCEEGDNQRKRRPGKRVNYTIVALKGLLYDFRRVNAKVTIDGKQFEYKDVWMVPAMNGRFYGGGMMCAPNQDRLNNNNKVSVIVVSSKSRVRLLIAFMSVFKGEHLKYKSIVTEHKGSDVTVEFDSPTALQIDGETVKNVLSYSVYRS